MAKIHWYIGSPLTLAPTYSIFKTELLRNKISNSFTCSSEHIPWDDVNFVVQSLYIKISKLN